MRAPPKLTEFSRYPVVAGTAALAIAVTVAWWLKVDISPLFDSAMIRRGELWRLVTSIFPHGGILHLAFNVYWLWVFGTLIEEQLGHLKTALLVLLFAFGSSAWEFALAVGGVGLSGVGYGFFGLLWILSRRDERFRDAIDPRTSQLFVGWFLFCIVTTLTYVMPVANIAHGVGAVLGILAGLAIALPDNRGPIAVGITSILILGLWGSTLGRPRVNLSKRAGYEEGKLGYDALLVHRNQDAVRWFRDAVVYQPKITEYWDDLGFAYEQLGDHPAAVAAYRRAADLGDAPAQYYLGRLYEYGGGPLSEDHAQALYWYRKAADQNYPDALNELAWTYATSADPSIRNASAALNYARKAVDLGKDHPVANHLDTLAEALYANGEYEDAVRTEQQALSLASPENKNAFEKRLEKCQRALKDAHRNRSK